MNIAPIFYFITIRIFGEGAPYNTPRNKGSGLTIRGKRQNAQTWMFEKRNKSKGNKKSLIWHFPAQ